MGGEYQKREVGVLCPPTLSVGGGRGGRKRGRDETPGKQASKIRKSNRELVFICLANSKAWRPTIQGIRYWVGEFAFSQVWD
ncbi:hypothetical protein CDAR_372281 [Caerostris darwini]|uniref:Uncharacterized protein n=1 Tax=Caerostris darwini TaxID=1538125 RepID=A0AAV4WWC1_9ARAC|nr:hypothetical protein CDAR_372281 [Caerostris darwini]